MTQAPLALEAPRNPSTAGEIERTAAEEWRESAIEVLYWLAEWRGKYLTFTADDWRHRCQFVCGEPHHPNEWGTAARIAKSRGIIADTGRYVRSKRPEANGRVIPVWRAG